MLQEFRIHIEADHASRRANALPQRPSDAARSTPDIETRPTLAHTDQVQHSLRIHRHGGTLDSQARYFSSTRLDWITAGESFGHWISPRVARLRLQPRLD